MKQKSNLKILLVKYRHANNIDMTRHTRCQLTLSIVLLDYSKQRFVGTQ